MKILQVNTVYPNGSTGRITQDIQKLSQNQNIDNRIAISYSNDKNNDIYEISSWLDNHIHNRLARMTMLEGRFSAEHTKRWLKQVDEYDPDIIHLHNIHGNYVNLKMLFSYINRKQIPVVWTLHDCWAFTGHCTYFSMCECEKWQTHCYKCPQFKSDPVNIVDLSSHMYSFKKNLFCSVDDMQLVTPSLWLASLTKSSFLGKYDVKVINNGIDLSVFKPIKSNFRKRYNIENKFIILGVAFDWGKRKGLDVFTEIANSLDDSYAIIMVGTTDTIDMQLPDRIITIHKTSDISELIEIYSTADVFVNPTREEVFGMTNIEALACGTPVITFNTGGSVECVDDTSGIVVKDNNACELLEAIYMIREKMMLEGKYSPETCIRRASKFDKGLKYNEYIKIYKELAK